MSHGKRRFGIVPTLAVAICLSATGAGPAAGQAAAIQPRYQLAPVHYSNQPESAARQEERGRFGDYVYDVIGPWSLIGIAGRSAVDHAREAPEEWGDDSEGFWKRLGSNAGRRFVQATVHHSLAAVLGRTTDYHPCGCSSFGGKLGNSFLEAVTDHDADGRRLFSVPQIAGYYSGAFAQLAWVPDPKVAEAALNGTLAIGFTAAGNFLLTEILGFGQ